MKLGFKNSFFSEIKFLFSGNGMPYEKVCIMVAMVISVILSFILSGNFWTIRVTVANSSLKLTRPSI